jgi:hypothetical protein
MQHGGNDITCQPGNPDIISCSFTLYLMWILLTYLFLFIDILVASVLFSCAGLLVISFLLEDIRVFFVFDFFGAVVAFDFILLDLIDLEISFLFNTLLLDKVRGSGFGVTESD